MFKKSKIYFGMFLALIMVMSKTMSMVWAGEEDSVYEPFIIVKSYKVSNDIIVPGKEFDLIVEVENTDSKVATSGSLLTLTSSDGISTTYQTPNQIYLSSLAPGEKREVVFKLYATSNYARSSAAFGITINSGVKSNYVNMFVPVQLDNNPFKIVSYNVPEEAFAGEKISVSFSLKSLLDEKLSNVNLSIYVDEDSRAVTATNIGNITAEASKTQNATFFINEIGSHSVKYVLSYSTFEGESFSTELYSGTIQINDPPKDNMSTDEEINDIGITDHDKLIIIGCLALSVLLFIGIIIIAKKNN